MRVLLMIFVKRVQLLFFFWLRPKQFFHFWVDFFPNSHRHNLCLFNQTWEKICYRPNFLVWVRDVILQFVILVKIIVNFPDDLLKRYLIEIEKVVFFPVKVLFYFLLIIQLSIFNINRELNWLLQTESDSIVLLIFQRRFPSDFSRDAFSSILLIWYKIISLIWLRIFGLVFLELKLEFSDWRVFQEMGFCWGSDSKMIIYIPL